MESPKIAHIIQLVNSDLHDKVTEAHSYSEHNMGDVIKELQLLLDNPTEIHQLTDQMFPEGIQVGEVFYSRLANAHYCLGREEVSRQILGNVFTDAYQRLSQTDGEKLLELLPSDNHTISPVLPSLPAFLSHTVLRNEFVAVWFLALAGKVACDLKGGFFFEGVYEYAVHFPEEGLKILNDYKRDKFEGFRIDLAAIILGAIRTCVDKGKIEKTKIDLLEYELRRHPNLSCRRSFNRSWLGYFRGRTVSSETLLAALDEMMNWTTEDIDDAFWVLSQCTLLRMNEPLFLEMAIKWFREKTAPDLPLAAKNVIANFAIRLMEKTTIPGSGVTGADTDNLLLAIQPISKDQQHILRTLELYLVDRLKNAKNEFGAFLRDLAVRSSGMLSELIGEDQLTYLVHELSSTEPSALITDLLLSEKAPERRLGRALLEEIQISGFDQSILKSKANKKKLQILLMEIARTPFSAETTSRVFPLLLPCYEITDAAIKEEFSEEMTFQAINYPGACYGTWKQITNPTPILVEVMAKTKTYFDGIDKVRLCSGGHLTFPEWNLAVKEWQRRFSNDVNAGARKASIFASLVRHIDIIYGSDWSIAGTQSVSDPQPMTRFSHGMEVPRLEILDPEGCAIRRLQYISRLQKLQEEESSSPDALGNQTP